MNELEVRQEKHLSVEEFYEANAIPEKEREEFEFIAGALTISYYRTMKEAFKIGGYAWHAHKRSSRSSRSVRNSSARKERRDDAQR